MKRRVLISAGLAVLAASSACDRLRGDALPGDTEIAATNVDQLSGGFIYGRVTTTDGEVHEGRLRFGGEEEALWSNQFNGRKDDNPWTGYLEGVFAAERPASREFMGLKLPRVERLDPRRPFMARFGDIALIEAEGRDLWVTLKSGTRFHLDRYEADDFADGVRIWDPERGVVDLPERKVRSIELSALPQPVSGPRPLFGSVRTANDVFTGLLQWDREASLVGDRLRGRTVEGEIAIPFQQIRSIAPRSPVGAVVTLVDGEAVTLTDTGGDGPGGRGVYVDDPRYGRVLVSWNALEGLELAPGPAAPAYEDFEPGARLTGTVVTRNGAQLTGYLVFDVDESETTETLDAPAGGVDYMIPFGMIAEIEPFGSEGISSPIVTLRSGEKLLLEPSGDLGEDSSGVLVFSADGARRDLVLWKDVEQIRLDVVGE